jgi:hypothetical protein
MTPKQMVKMLDSQLADAYAEIDKLRAEIADINASLVMLKTDDDFRAAGWRAVARDSDGHAVSVMPPGFFDEYTEWIGEHERAGNTVTEFTP